MAPSLRGFEMISKSLQLWKDDTGQDIAEYAVMLAVILVLSSFHPLTQRPSKQRIDFDAGEVCEAAPQNIGCQTRAWPNFQHIRAKINTSHEAAYVVGVDLGSFYFRVVATDIVGNLVYKLRTETRIRRRTPAQ